jgi:hypothetical protein
MTARRRPAVIQEETTTMETTERSLTKCGTRRNLCGEIARQRDLVLDLDIVVDDTRLVLNHCVEEFRKAVCARDHAARHLAKLIDWHEEVESISVTFGSEIADTFSLQLEARG